ncbi:hypothetical protein GCM10025878_09720 [Leuconostoc gasicomitatum]|nr:hypothetical protein GCM10025878_09720 [Leuconostoc gasicomitatum]
MLSKPNYLKRSAYYYRAVVTNMSRQDKCIKSIDNCIYTLYDIKVVLNIFLQKVSENRRIL